MNTKEYSNIPGELFYYITFLARALPARSIKTFIELLIGCLLTQSGFVTSAWWILDMKNHWFSYHKWLEAGKWSYLKLMRQWVKLFIHLFGQERIYLCIDDSIVLRASKKAPASQIHHQHGNKPDLSSFVRGQCWVGLAATVERLGKNTALPLLFRLPPDKGNTSKIQAAKTLLRSIRQLLKNNVVTVLADSWYMRRSFIQAQVNKGFTVIGQVRIDTVFYQLPKAHTGRGRPRKYGKKYTKQDIMNLPVETTTRKLYGREQTLHYRTKVAQARFLKGQLVRFVWCEFEDDKGTKKPRLLLSTDTELTALQIILAYEKRWSIEPMFNQMKNAWGMKQAWQQTRQVLHRWVHLIALGYVLPQLLAIKCHDKVEPLLKHAPWQSHTDTTAGRIRMGLLKYFSHVRVRDWWCMKYRKFQPPDTNKLAEFEAFL
ncbi:MAG TPA: transposase [Gammaproteobacteria bacterium]|nr:transposase [Gammaproteobacteria bacterium]